MHKFWSTKAKSANETAQEVSLSRTVPFTHIICIIFGVPLSSPRKRHHLVTYLAFFLLRIVTSYGVLEPEMSSGVSLVAIAHVLSLLFGFFVYWLLIQRREVIVTFLSSNAEAVGKMKNIDRLHPLMHCGPILLADITFSVSSVGPCQKELFASALDCCPTLRLVLCEAMLLLALFLYQTATLCMVTYALGYCVLYAEKSSVLTLIGRTWKSVEYDVIVRQLKSVSVKQERFESIFGPFLFICLCQTFLNTVDLIYTIQVVLFHRMNSLTLFVASGLLTQVSCVGLTFYVCICNDRLKSQAASVSFQMEQQLARHSATTLLLISKLQRRISETINEPLTAWKMLTVDRQIALSIAASCVSFSVLYIQINNGALNSK